MTSGASMDAAGLRKPVNQNHNETPSRKPSFKCGGPGTRVSYRSVRALTNQFDSLSANRKLKANEQSVSTVRSAIDKFENATIRPVAAIKPICKPKLVPKDSLCRARYNDMRRSSKPSLVRSTTTEETKKVVEIKINEQSVTPNNEDACKPYTVQLRKQLDEKSLEDLKVRLGKENISVTTSPISNYSSVFDKISTSGVANFETRQPKTRMFAKLMKQDEITKMPDNMKPNMSFLWKNQPEATTPTEKSSINDTPLPKPPESVITDCIYESIRESHTDDDDDNNEECIYDDIGAPNSSLYCISEKLDDNIYEDINLENIYDCQNVVYGHDVVYQSICGESVQSSYEKNNSLYESGGNANITGIASELNLLINGMMENDSDTASDEWLEESDDSEPQPFQINRRGKRHNGTKNRPKWAELQKKANEKREDVLTLNEDEEHLYESIPLHQTQESQDLTDDVEDIDDFDSSNEEDDDCPETQLPAEPAQYNLTRSLRAAGKRLRQNLTLRKSDLSKSLKKFRRKNGEKSELELGSKFYTDVRQINRPQSPPPPPPPASTDNASSSSNVQYSDVRVNNGPDLYAECGLFKQRSRSTTLWYTEAGLYGDKENAVPVKGFSDEPLYQFYTECVNAQARSDILQFENDDILNHYYTLINDNRKTLDLKAMPQRNLSTYHALNRTLWCQMPEVEASCVVPTLTEQQRKLQEAKFEIITSEGSYIHSLNVLENHFMTNLSELISPRFQKLLFTNIIAVKAVSQRLLNDLESSWRHDIMLMDICDIISQHAQQDFDVYVKFCKHHTAVYRTLANLLETNSAFAALVKQLESAALCCGLSLHSFLLLPMQRITRLPLLVGAVLSRLDKEDTEYESCKTAFEVLNKIVKDCNEEATKMEKCEEMLLLSQQLVFPNTVRTIPIISGNRCLVKRGTATMVVGKDESKLTFGRRLNKFKLHLLLFTDLLLLARSKGRGELSVIDFCARNLVHFEQSNGVHIGTGHVMLLTLLENHENKTAEMMLSFGLESEVSRWQDALSPIQSTNPMESVYEEWDCPQMIVIYEFNASQPDELTLAIGDIVNVLKKIQDGWYLGERLRDAARGWFPSNHVQEISSQHIRAKNKKLRYKLLSQISQISSTTT